MLHFIMFYVVLSHDIEKNKYHRFWQIKCNDFFLQETFSHGHINTLRYILIFFNYRKLCKKLRAQHSENVHLDIGKQYYWNKPIEKSI